MSLTEREWSSLIGYNSFININTDQEIFKTMADFTNFPDNRVDRIKISGEVFEYELKSFKGLPEDIDIEIYNLTQECVDVLNTLPNKIKRLEIMQFGFDLKKLRIRYLGNKTIENLTLKNLELDFTSISEVQIKNELHCYNCDFVGENLNPLEDMEFPSLRLEKCTNLKNLDYLPKVNNLYLINLDLENVDNLPETLNDLYIREISNKKITNLGKLKHITGSLSYDRKESFSNKFVFPKLESINNFNLDNNTIVKFPKGYKLPNMERLYINLKEPNTLKLDYSVLPEEVDDITVYGKEVNGEFKNNPIVLPKVNEKIELEDIPVDVESLFKSENLDELILKNVKLDMIPFNFKENLMNKNGTIEINISLAKDNNKKYYYEIPLLLEKLKIKEIDYFSSNILSEKIIKLLPDKIDTLYYNQSYVSLDSFEEILNLLIYYDKEVNNLNYHYTSSSNYTKEVSELLEKELKAKQNLGILYELLNLS